MRVFNFLVWILNQRKISAKLPSSTNDLLFILFTSCSTSISYSAATCDMCVHIKYINSPTDGSTISVQTINNLIKTLLVRTAMKCFHESFNNYLLQFDFKTKLTTSNECQRFLRYFTYSAYESLEQFGWKFIKHKFPTLRSLF